MSRKMALLPSSDSTSWGKGPYVTHLRLSAVTDGAGSLWTRGWGRRKAGISEFIKKQNQLYKYIIYKNQKAWTSTQSKISNSQIFLLRGPFMLLKLENRLHQTGQTELGKSEWDELCQDQCHGYHMTVWFSQNFTIERNRAEEYLWINSYNYIWIYSYFNKIVILRFLLFFVYLYCNVKNSEEPKDLFYVDWLFFFF